MNKCEWNGYTLHGENVHLLNDAQCQRVFDEISNPNFAGKRLIMHIPKSTKDFVFKVGDPAGSTLHVVTVEQIVAL